MKDALRYAVLGSLRSDRDTRWQVNDDTRAMTDEAFEMHVAALCATAKAVRAERTNDGSRTVERIKERVALREKQLMRRTALDLQQLADLQDRMELREAQSARRRWFVLGRLLSDAARNDAHWAEVMRVLVRDAPLSAQEARLLGVARRRTQ